MRMLSLEEAKKLYAKKLRNLTLEELSQRMFNPEDINKITTISEKEEKMKKKILVVDDEPHIVDLIKFSLDPNKFEIIEAYSGTDAIELAIKEQPDLITLDIMMPNMDGFEICKHLKENSITRNIPVIMISAKNLIQDKFKGIDSGAVDYLEKPFEPEELRRKIETNLD